MESESLDLANLNYLLVAEVTILVIAVDYIYEKLIKPQTDKIVNPFLKAITDGIFLLPEIFADVWFRADNFIQKIGIPIGAGLAVATLEYIGMMKYYYYVFYGIGGLVLFFLLGALYDRLKEK